MKLVTQRGLFSVSFVIMLLCSHSSALANSAPPPMKIWVTFESSTSSAYEWEAVQLVVCAEELCELPVFVQQYGSCEAEGCLFNLPEPPSHSTFECFRNRCLGTVHFPYYEESQYFKLIVQFPDHTRESNVLADLPAVWKPGEERAWSVQIQDAALAVTPDAAFVSPVVPLSPLLSGLLLTLIVELLVTVIALWSLARKERALLSRRLLIVFLINLLTYPLVWLIFPAMRQFQPQYLRAISPYVGVATLLYTAAMVWIYLTREKKRLIGIIASVVVLPLVTICVFFALIVTGYGNYEIAVPGLSPGMSLLLTEITVVLMETVLLYVLNRKTLSWTWAGALSLVMNLASFLAGQVIFQ